MPDFIAQIVEKCGDYRREEGFDFNEDHVAEWVEQFPERRDEVHFPSQPAIEEIAGSGDNEQNQRGNVSPGAFPCDEADEGSSQDKTGNGDRIRKVHMDNVGN